MHAQQTQPIRALFHAAYCAPIARLAPREKTNRQQNARQSARENAKSEREHCSAGLHRRLGSVRGAFSLTLVVWRSAGVLPGVPWRFLSATTGVLGRLGGSRSRATHRRL